jgi:hypothetical protein
MMHDPRSPRPHSGPTSVPQRRCGAAGRGVWACLVLAVGCAGCATFRGDEGQPLVPSRYQTRTGPFAIFTGAPIAPEAPPVRNLSALEHDLTATLGLKVASDDAPVEVYILRDRETFNHFLKFYFPELPPRRAFFIAQGPRRVVYTYQNDRLDEDLRHEATHALLHLAVGDLPLWLDEGLAEYFEGPDGRKGLNPEHIARLPDDLKAGWRPDLARLETLKNVREMTPRDYREAWAWVHCLLNEPGPGKADLLGYLADLRESPGQAVRLSERLARTDRTSAQRLLTHIERMRTDPAPAPVATTPPKEPTILLQNSPIEAASRPITRRSFFKSVLGFFGLGSPAS